MTLPVLLTPEQVAERTGRSVEWVIHVARGEAAPSIRVGRSFRVLERDLEEWQDVASFVSDDVGEGIGSVYFVQGVYGGPVKIGFASDPLGRLRNLQVCSPVPLTLLATETGTIHLERKYHERFEEWRLHGEWFAWEAPGLSQMISRLQRGRTKGASDD